ncbi:hypothetical protein GGX14DRAFT_658107 [Mycena pura]|uniref:Protein kinase domain-containing protein n=1 Tax=Mycena pura TaxID=153505 RepID=A0AAD6YMB6_9AGAR|nr:hypothetical protein GGX14DRAFT_658107 [Mycena pura]
MATPWPQLRLCGRMSHPACSVIPSLRIFASYLHHRMDDDPHPTFELNSAQLDERGSRDQSTGAFFLRSSQFSISGGVFTNNITHVHQAPANVLSGMQYFRMIPLGDLDLLRETRLDNASGISLLPARKVLSSEAVYQGDKVDQEKWQEDVSKYANLRHPNIVQIYGVTVSSGIHATVFHDEKKYRRSPIATVYFWSFAHAFFYLASVAGNYLMYLVRLQARNGVTLWIRASTGRLCVEFTPNAHDELMAMRYKGLSSQINLLEPDQASKMIDAMSLADYHDACAHQQSIRAWEVSSPVKLGTVGVLTPMDEKWTELAYITPRVRSSYPSTWDCQNSLIMENGWTRMAIPGQLHLQLSQCNFESPTCRDCFPKGFLFLCPATDLRTDDGSMLQHLDSVAYWSLDPTGIERLSAEDAKDLGFPAIKLKMTAWGHSFNGSVYDGLREFHQAKGFNPDSQDVARHLGCPLCELAPGVDPQFAFSKLLAVHTSPHYALIKIQAYDSDGGEGSEDDKPIYERIDSSDESVLAGDALARFNYYHMYNATFDNHFDAEGLRYKYHNQKLCVTTLDGLFDAEGLAIAKFNYYHLGAVRTYPHMMAIGALNRTPGLQRALKGPKHRDLGPGIGPYRQKGNL